MSVSTYEGEEIIANIIIKGGKKYEERVWMPRTVFNDPAGKDAYIIGNGPSRQGFDLYSLPQDTYGCNALHRDYTPDYLIVVDRKMYKEIKDSEYGEKNTVYTNHYNMQKFGGTCHLIPGNPYKGAGPTATHIAIHDGHTNLIMLGFDCAEDGVNNNIYVNTDCYADDKSVVSVSVWGRQIAELMQANPNVFFTFVEGSQPNNLKELPNYRYITYAELNTYINQHGQET
jgi:hypothetical protein